MKVWNMTIACALRWGVALVGNILYQAWLTLYGKTFQVQGVPLSISSYFKFYDHCSIIEMIFNKLHIEVF